MREVTFGVGFQTGFGFWRAAGAAGKAFSEPPPPSPLAYDHGPAVPASQPSAASVQSERFIVRIHSASEAVLVGRGIKAE